MAKRRKRRTFRPSAAEYTADVQRRLIEVLIAVAPDAPVPLGLVGGIVSTESILGGPSSSLAENIREAPALMDTTVEQAEDLRQLATDRARGTCVVTAAQQERLRALFATLPLTPQAIQRRHNNLDRIRNALIIEMYDAASYTPGIPNDTYTPDHIALMVPHLLHLMHVEVTEPHGDWIPIQALTTLWLLHDHGVVPESVVGEQTHTVMAYCETTYQAWRGWLPASLLIQAVEEMVKAEWEQAPRVGGRALEMAENIIGDPPDGEWENEEDEHELHAIADLRQKLGRSERTTAGSD